jgi:hypothetical protein
MMSGDILMAVSAGNASTPSYSAEAIAAVTGITIGAVSERADSGTSGGDDIRLVIATASITAGAATDDLTYTMTGSAAASGITAIIRIREHPRRLRIAA